MPWGNARTSPPRRRGSGDRGGPGAVPPSPRAGAPLPRGLPDRGLGGRAGGVRGSLPPASLLPLRLQGAKQATHRGGRRRLLVHAHLP